jgi:osmotically-inducible protein OsmY
LVVTERFYPRAIVCLAVILASSSLAGCVLPIIAGTAVGGYTLATEQRSPEQLARDAAFGAAAHKYWADASSDLARDVSATVYDGRMLITGIVPNQAMKDAAERLARQIQGVREIDNEVQIGQPTTFGQDARDNYVSNALRSQMLADPQVRSSNFIVHTLNGIVYIMGYARNAAERDLVLSYARNLSNVNQVKSYIEVANAAPSAPAAARGPSSAPPPPSSPEAPPSAAPPRSIIQVQPLQ